MSATTLIPSSTFGRNAFNTISNWRSTMNNKNLMNLGPSASVLVSSDHQESEIEIFQKHK
jgi:hypothetical protein